MIPDTVLEQLHHGHLPSALTCTQTPAGCARLHAAFCQQPCNDSTGALVDRCPNRHRGNGCTPGGQPLGRVQPAQASANLYRRYGGRHDRPSLQSPSLEGQHLAGQQSQSQPRTGWGQAAMQAQVAFCHYTEPLVAHSLDVLFRRQPSLTEVADCTQSWQWRPSAMQCWAPAVLSGHRNCLLLNYAVQKILNAGKGRCWPDAVMLCLLLT